MLIILKLYYVSDINVAHITTRKEKIVNLKKV
jgi:hypothetical protein